MSSKHLQSLWVQRLRRGDDSHAPKAREVERRWTFEQEEEVDGIDMEEKSRYAICQCLVPKVEVENVLDRRLPNIDNNTPESTDLVTETQVIASFGPFQVRNRSLIPLTRSDSYVKEPSGMNTHRPALLPLADDQWKHYSQRRGKAEATDRACDNRLRMGDIDQDRHGFTSGLLASTFMGASHCKPIIYDYRNKHSTIDSHNDLSTQHKLRKFQWDEPHRQKPEDNIWNPGVCKEIVPSTRDHSSSSNQKRDWTECERPENWKNNCYADQEATWKPASESLPNIKANLSDAECSRREQLHGTSIPQPLVGGYRYGIEQETRGFDSMGRYPFHSDIFHSPNYPGLGNQKDKIMPPHKSASTASLPNNVSGGFHDKTTDRKKLNTCGFYPGTGTTLIESDVNNCRPIRERGYLESDVHSSHHSNCPGLGQENLSKALNRDTRLSKQFNIVKDGWLDVKGKASNLEKTVREQIHDKEVAGGYTGYAFQNTSYDDAIHQAIQERCTVTLSCRSDLQALTRCLSPQAKPVSFCISDREEEIGRERDGSVKGNLKDDKISIMVHCVPPGKEYPRNNIDFNVGKTGLDGHEFNQFKSRKQSAEEGPTFQRLQKFSNHREAELDCTKHVGLKISSVDGQAYISGKKTCCTNKKLVQTGASVVNNIATTSEANAVKDSRPEMWLQRWIHSTERSDLVSENLNCNSLKAHESLARTCTREWSGDNAQTDFIHWTKKRKDDYISFSDTRPQTWGHKHFKSDIKGSQSMKTFLTSSASAMAIMGTRVKEMYAAQSRRNEIFPVCADADAKATGSGKEMTTRHELELKPKKAFEQEIFEHKDIRV